MSRGGVPGRDLAGIGPPIGATVLYNRITIRVLPQGAKNVLLLCTKAGACHDGL